MKCEERGFRLRTVVTGACALADGTFSLLPSASFHPLKSCVCIRASPELVATDSPRDPICLSPLCSRSPMPRREYLGPPWGFFLSAIFYRDILRSDVVFCSSNSRRAAKNGEMKQQGSGDGSAQSPFSGRGEGLVSAHRSGISFVRFLLHHLCFSS